MVWKENKYHLKTWIIGSLLTLNLFLITLLYGILRTLGTHTNSSNICQVHIVQWISGEPVNRDIHAANNDEAREGAGDLPGDAVPDNKIAEPTKDTSHQTLRMATLNIRDGSRNQINTALHCMIQMNVDLPGLT